MSSDYKQRVVDLLKALETGDSKPFSYINPNKYIQHNLDVAGALLVLLPWLKACRPGQRSTRYASFRTATLSLPTRSTISSARRSASTSFALKMA
jgi:hypothetical protein